MTGFSDQQLTSLKAPLSGDKVKTRRQAGRELSYIEGWLVISEANRIFGFDAWDRETIECRCVSEKAAKLGPNKDRDGWRVAYVGKVRIKVRAGDQVIIREGTGYGSGIDADIGEAHESAAKECETDATKRAMMTFGSPMGLALYDKAQAEVEPVANARRTAPPNGKAPLTPAEQTAFPNERERRAKAATEAKRRITEALGVATTPALIEEIVKINAADLEEIMMLHRPSYDAVMELATRLKSDMYAATG